VGGGNKMYLKFNLQRECHIFLAKSFIEKFL